MAICALAALRWLGRWIRVVMVMMMMMGVAGLRLPTCLGMLSLGVGDWGCLYKLSRSVRCCIHRHVFRESQAAFHRRTDKQ